MDPLSVLYTLVTSTQFGLPLLLIVFGAVAWAIGMVKVNPPILFPRPIWREPSPDSVSTLYWALASDARASVVQYVYHRWSDAVRKQYHVFPYDIPWRRSKARKHGIEDPRPLIALDKLLLDLYYRAQVLDNRTPDALTGELLWRRRTSTYERLLAKALDQLNREFPQLWGVAA
ncbi:MAG: hypothetical protein M1144_06385 [Candidatus Thermoplasmatota archaeon]|jgi:hypothetical protein|nr:hypothetical protein [Candidatus Thermoplasmatota archaeon]MCL5984114.1 hypothetical protein [Candidatus Thermoplasmatota archaeon]